MTPIRWLGVTLAIATGAVSASAAQGGSSVEQGLEVYRKWCAPCHYRIVAPAPLPERTDLTPARVTQAVRTGVFVMPMFRKTEISDAELAALSAYLTRNAVGDRR